MNMTLIDYMQFGAAFLFVIGLIFGLSWLLRRFGLGDGASNPLGRKRRIATVESTAIDSRTRLVLVRRDEIEHLLLVSPNSSTVIERGISPANTGSTPMPAAAD